MKKRQVLTLWVIAIALGGAVVAVKFSQSHANSTTTQRKPGETLLQVFPANDVATLEIRGVSDQVTLTKKDGTWVVANRDNFPANATYVNSFLLTLSELKVTRGMEAGPSFAPRFGMDESSTKPAERGLTAHFKDAAGQEIAKISLGKNIEGNAERSPFAMGGGGVGRYVWNHGDSSGFYAVNEMFPSVSADSKRWLANGFINPEKIKSIAVTEPGKSESAWKITRDSDEAEFKLDAAQPEEVLDSSTADTLKGLLSYARFEDVIPATQVAEKTIPDQQYGAVIETFEGFTYALTLSPAKPAAAPAEPTDPDEVPPATDNYLMSVKVSAVLPTERTKSADEKPEDAKTKDEEFAARQKELSEKLSKEKAFSGITFEVSKSLVEPLLKDRKSLTTEAEPADGDDNSQGNIQQFPGGLITPPMSATTPPIQAVTPPIQIPPTDEAQETPADDPIQEAPANDPPQETPVQEGDGE
jgi:hypothetical protein